MVVFSMFFSVVSVSLLICPYLNEFLLLVCVLMVLASPTRMASIKPFIFWKYTLFCLLSLPTSLKVRMGQRQLQ